MAGNSRPAQFGTRSARELLAQAQSLIFRAWETTNRKWRIVLATKALAISPNCADAYVVLAEAAVPLKQSLELYRQAVQAGERTLGKRAFREDVGYFWRILETRPYMRARAGLARCLWESNQRNAALEHYRELLRLNPNDNQGIRYILASCLLELDRNEEVARLLDLYPGDVAATWPWTSALLAFRKQGDNPDSRSRLAAALEVNPHIPAFLLGKKQLPRRLPDLVGFGDESEAICYAAENLKVWQASIGALLWLAERINPEKPAILQ
jgi:tetratricopeptide (TPR) repeat protein